MLHSKQKWEVECDKKYKKKISQAEDRATAQGGWLPQMPNIIH